MKPELDKCKNGHFKTPATQYVNEKTGGKACRLCRLKTSRAIHKREKDLIAKSIERLKEVEPC